MSAPELRVALERPPDDERATVLALVQRHGWNATSFQVLEPGYRYLFVGSDVCIAYVDTGKAWVAAGAPLAEDGRMAEATAAFIAAARKAGRRACLFATEERFASLVALPSFPIGEQPVWDPGTWPATLARSRRLREQLRRARAKGVRVRAIDAQEATAADTSTRAAVSDLVRRWLQSRELAPMGFLVQVEPFTLLPGHRLFVAERNHQVIALLLMTPIYARGGWLFQHLIRAPNAPNGTTETLVDHAMRLACRDGATLVTLGLAPLAGEVSPPLRFARWAGRALFDFEGLRSFKAKLHPARWERVFLSFPPEVTGPRALADVLRAFAPGGPLRFGIRTLFRGPTVAVRLLALLLLPWTMLLASADSRTWFPHPIVKWAWVAFDLCLAAGFYSLQRRWRTSLARALMAAAATDAALTLIEASAWNASRTAGCAGRAVVALAVAAPLVAFVALWRTLARRRSTSPHEAAIA